MNYINIPLDFTEGEIFVSPLRKQMSKKELLDKLIDMIVFTPRGSFSADPDFGFRYWDNEYANVIYTDFNSDQNKITNGEKNEVTKEKCKNSIKENLATYAPYLQIDVDGISLIVGPAEVERQNKEQGRHVYSRSKVTLSIKGRIMEEDSSTIYQKEVVFFMEPTVKRYKI